MMDSNIPESQDTNVQVVVRLRPLNAREQKANTLPVVSASQQRKEVQLVRGVGPKAVRHDFYFDAVFNAFTTQEEVFNQTLKPIVGDVLRGFECTVFAYGQTGTGKTFTMEGDIDSEQNLGVIPRACNFIFNALATPEKYTESAVCVSFLEIYNEELNDLLSDVNSPLKVCEDRTGRVVCMGLSKKDVNSSAEVLTTLRAAQARRQTGETKMNKNSSRSHCLFTLEVRSKELTAEGLVERRGKIHMVDLAGSECAKTTGADAGSARLRESQNINKSLLTLGRVIEALRTKSGRVPYRDSKLTRLLQEALGGRSKTCIIATLSPSVLCVEETLSTLNYADAAQSIKNKPISAAVRMQAGGTSSSIIAGSDDTHDRRSFAEMEQRMKYMEGQLEEAQAALGRQYDERTHLEDRAAEAEAKAAEMEKSLALAAESLIKSQAQLEEANQANASVLNTLEATRFDLAERNVISSARAEAEHLIRAEAIELLACVETVLAHRQHLHSQLEAHTADQQRIKQSTASFSEDLNKLMLKAGEDSKALFDGTSSDLVEFSNTLQIGANLRLNSVTSLESAILALTKDVKSSIQAINALISSSVVKFSDAGQRAEEANARSLAILHKVNEQGLTTAQAQRQNLLQHTVQTELALVNQAQIARGRLSASRQRLTEILADHTSLLEQQADVSLISLETAEVRLGKSTLTLTEAADALQAQLDALDVHTRAQEQASAELLARLDTVAAGLSSQRHALRAACDSQRIAESQIHAVHMSALAQLCTAVAQNSATQQAALNEQHALLMQTQRELSQELLPSLSSHLAHLRTQAQQLGEGASNIDSQLALQRASLDDTSAEQETSLTITERTHLASLAGTRAIAEEAHKVVQDKLTSQQAGLNHLIAHELEATAQPTCARSMEALQYSRSFLNTCMLAQRHQLQANHQTMNAARTTLLEQQTVLESTHRASIQSAEMRAANFSRAQLALLAEQSQVLEATRLAQEQGRQQVLSTVMAGLQQLLSAKMDEMLGASLTAQLAVFTQTNSTLQQEAKQLGSDFAMQATLLRRETDSWHQLGSAAAQSLDSLSHCTRALDTSIAETSEEVATQYDGLVKGAQALAAGQERVVVGLHEARQRSETAVEDLRSCQTALTGQFASLAQESERWAARERGVGKAIQRASLQASAASQSLQAMTASQLDGHGLRAHETLALEQAAQSLHAQVGSAEQRNRALAAQDELACGNQQQQLDACSRETLQLHTAFEALNAACEANSIASGHSISDLGGVVCAHNDTYHKASLRVRGLLERAELVQMRHKELSGLHASLQSTRAELNSHVAASRIQAKSDGELLESAVGDHMAAELAAVDAGLEERSKVHAVSMNLANALEQTLSDTHASLATSLAQTARTAREELQAQTARMSSLQAEHSTCTQALDARREAGVTALMEQVAKERGATEAALQKQQQTLAKMTRMLGNRTQQLSGIASDTKALAGQFATGVVQTHVPAPAPATLESVHYPAKLSEPPSDDKVLEASCEAVAELVRGEMEKTRQALPVLSLCAGKENVDKGTASELRQRRGRGALKQISNLIGSELGSRGALKRPAIHSFGQTAKDATQRSAKKVKNTPSRDRSARTPSQPGLRKPQQGLLEPRTLNMEQ